MPGSQGGADSELEMAAHSQPPFGLVSGLTLKIREIEWGGKNKSASSAFKTTQPRGPSPRGYDAPSNGHSCAHSLENERASSPLKLWRFDPMVRGELPV